MTARGRKERADMLLLRQGLAPSREKAKALIMAGLVFAGTNRVLKAGELIAEDSALQVKGQAIPYVGRGGLKLEKALRFFAIGLRGKTLFDIGASTGGFTDCALQNGAKKVYAIDVGYGQLDWKLRQDPRVVVMEKTNARYLTAENFEEKADFITVDVSFISLDKILPVLPALLGEKGSGVALIKPQFEAGREQVGKRGVVAEPGVHRRVIEKILALLPGAGLRALGLTYSPIKGPEGNIEYLLYFRMGETDEAANPFSPEGAGDAVVMEAFAALSGKAGAVSEKAGLTPEAAGVVSEETGAAVRGSRIRKD